MKIYDISRPLTNDLAPWPGDVGFRYQLNGRIADGSSVNVGSIKMSLHNGTHGDAKYHFDDTGWTIDDADLSVYFGPAVVVDLTAKYSPGKNEYAEIEVADLQESEDAIARTRRVLLRTGVFPDSTQFPAEIPVIASGLAEWLGARGVRLLGLDIPSVDRVHAKNLVNHHALGAAGISIVESLDLSEIEGGEYNLIALPLKIAGGDGSPVRAVLWR